MTAKQLTAPYPVSRAEIDRRVVNYVALWDSLFKSLPKVPKRKRVPIPQGASKEEKRVRRVLRDFINADNSIGPNLGHYAAWMPGDQDIELDSSFTLEELDAFVWWLRNKNTK